MVWQTDMSEVYDLELRAELSPGHPLEGVRTETVAVRCNKDTIQWLPETRSWALRHLTWRNETDPYTGRRRSSATAGLTFYT